MLIYKVLCYKMFGIDFGPVAQLARAPHLH